MATVLEFTIYSHPPSPSCPNWTTLCYFADEVHNLKEQRKEKFINVFLTRAQSK